MLSFQWIQKQHKPLLEKYHSSLEAKFSNTEYHLNLSTNELIVDLLAIEAIQKNTNLDADILKYHFNIVLSLVGDNMSHEYPTDGHSVALYGLLHRLIQECLFKPIDDKYPAYFGAIVAMRALIEQAIVHIDLALFSKSKEMDIVLLCTSLLSSRPFVKDGNIWKGEWVKIIDTLLCPVEAQVWFIMFLVCLNGEYDHLTSTRSMLLQKCNKYFEGKVRTQLLHQLPILEQLWQRIAVIGLEPTVPDLVIFEIDYLFEKMQSPVFYNILWHQSFKNWDDIELFIDTNKVDNYSNYVASSINMNMIEKMCNRCQYCGELASKKCAKCKSVVYCTRDCQMNDWASHKTKCQ